MEPALNLAELDAVALPPELPANRELSQQALGQVVARLSADVSGPLTQALQRVVSLGASGSIDRQSLHALWQEIDSARRAGLMSQQIARFVTGQAHPGIERVQLTDVLRDVLTEQSASAGGVGHRQKLGHACVMGDASLIHTLLQATAAWASANARTPIEWTLETEPWPPQARLTCRFDLLAQDLDVAANHGEALEALDSLDWLLMGYAAHLSSAALNRAVHDGRCLVTLRFRHVVNDSLEGASAVDMGSVAGSRAVLTGCQVLVLAARREARQRVREALRGHEVFIDYAPNVAAAGAYCDDGSPQVLVYESGFESEALRNLHARLAKLSPSVVLIEVTPTGDGCEMGPGGIQLGAEGLSQSLAAVLLMVLSEHG